MEEGEGHQRQDIESCDHGDGTVLTGISSERDIPGDVANPAETTEQSVPRRRRVRRMSLLSITAKPTSPTAEGGQDTTGFVGAGIGGVSAGTLEAVLEQEVTNPEIFSELQQRVQRRRRRSVDTVAEELQDFEKTINIGLDNLALAIQGHQEAEEGGDGTTEAMRVGIDRRQRMGIGGTTWGVGYDTRPRRHSAIAIGSRSRVNQDNKGPGRAPGVAGWKGEVAKDGGIEE
eukprot:gnl/Chilomastix_caulleri/1414.p1 GENE.gnl/Chilomastix_caulleri/1414~~gnl/Chilomastix_caulleri/1414.p1  ORF type:complete len:231 (+),score=85.76 gnl/Chilomastix_caulleri/1414:34-726(+)